MIEHGTGWRSATAAARLCGLLLFCVVSSGRAEDVKLVDCPEPVRATIATYGKNGKLDDIKKFSIGDHVLYLVHFDLKGFRDLRLQVRGDGTLQKSVEEIRRQDLPEKVRAALNPILTGGGHIEEVEKVIADGQIQYRIELEVPHKPDQVMVFDAEGGVLEQK